MRWRKRPVSELSTTISVTSSLSSEPILDTFKMFDDDFAHVPYASVSAQLRTYKHLYFNKLMISPANMAGTYGLYIGKIAVFLQPGTAIGGAVFGEQQIEDLMAVIVR